MNRKKIIKRLLENITDDKHSVDAFLNKFMRGESDLVNALNTNNIFLFHENASDDLDSVAIEAQIVDLNFNQMPAVFQTLCNRLSELETPNNFYSLADYQGEDKNVKKEVVEVLKAYFDKHTKTHDLSNVGGKTTFKDFLLFMSRKENYLSELVDKYKSLHYVINETNVDEAVKEVKDEISVIVLGYNLYHDSISLNKQLVIETLKKHLITYLDDFEEFGKLFIKDHALPSYDEYLYYAVQSKYENKEEYVGLVDAPKDGSSPSMEHEIQKMIFDLLDNRDAHDRKEAIKNRFLETLEKLKFTPSGFFKNDHVSIQVEMDSIDYDDETVEILYKDYDRRKKYRGRIKLDNIGKYASNRTLF